MKDSQLEKMSYQELIDLQARVKTAIAGKQVKEREAVRQKVKALAEEAGFSVTELFGGGGRGRGRGVAPKVAKAVKYRHPDDASLTWSGRGRKPKWLSQAGGSIERFRVA